MPNVRAKETFHYPGEGGYTASVRVGELFDSDDPCVKGRESLFEPVEVAVARRAGVEEATAEPNELRSVSTVPHKRGPGRPRKSESAEDE